MCAQGRGEKLLSSAVYACNTQMSRNYNTLKFYSWLEYRDTAALCVELVCILIIRKCGFTQLVIIYTVYIKVFG